MKPDARAKVDYKPVGVSDVTLGSIDLGKEPAHIEGRELRFRRLTASRNRLLIDSFKTILTNNFADQKFRIARLRNTNVRKHLAHNNFNMFIVNYNTLQTINFLNFIN